jgi:hypothetical protein
MLNRQKIVVAGLIGMFAQTCQSMNLLRPYDSLIRPMYNNDYRWQISVWADTGISDKAFNGDNCRVNALRVWNADQNALAMLNGFSPDSPISKKLLALDADDDGTRGHFLVCGDLKNKFSGMFAFRGFFRDTWSISFYLPLYAMELTNVCWVDQTKHENDEDARVHELLTDNFFQNVCELGCDLDLCGWKRTGVGDLTVLLEWFRDFPQQKPMLKNVRINWRGGLSLPTGLRQDVDKIFAIPFGNDGAFALPFGFGLDLDFAFYVRAGFDVQLTHIFGNTRMRRIKTSANQTDLLLLEKMAVYKDFGLTQQFNLYAQLYKIVKGFSVLLGYQFLKQGKDTVALCPGADFSAVVANSAEYLKERTIHQIIVRADYEIGSHFEDPPIYPRFSFFAQLPFNGKRVAVTSNIGITLALDF